MRRVAGAHDDRLERYRGQGRRGFRESTREEYRRLIRAYAHRHFPRKLKLADVSTYALARYMDCSPMRRSRASASATARSPTR